MISVRPLSGKTYGLTSNPIGGPVVLAVLTSTFLLAGCSGAGKGSAAAQQPAGPTPITVTTTTLPNGQVNHAYAAKLTATGGTAPLSWSLNSGALPAGLTLAYTGDISGTPTETAAAKAIRFTVMDSSAKAQTQDITINLTVSPEDI